MTKRKLVTISMQPEDEELLNSIAVEVGLNRSELIRRMIYKISFDEKMRAIIKRGKVTTSYNVHYANDTKKADETEENKRAGDQPGSDSSSLESTQIIQDIHYEHARKYTVSTISQKIVESVTNLRICGKDEEEFWRKSLQHWNLVLKAKRELAQ